MISNRQGGRRRGRGGGRSPSMNAGGNRQDNRQRGNAAQLLEKYKGLARDAQMQGDRVQTENYLQFADHYYRILNENRARFEEQRRQRDDNFDSGYEDDEQEESEGAREAGDRQDAEESEISEAEGRRDERRQQGNGEYRTRRPRSRRSEETAEEGGEGERIAVDSLPPSISDGDAGEEEPARAPRRRARRPRPSDEEVAPAA